MSPPSAATREWLGYDPGVGAAKMRLWERLRRAVREISECAENNIAFFEKKTLALVAQAVQAGLEGTRERAPLAGDQAVGATKTTDENLKEHPRPCRVCWTGRGLQDLMKCPGCGGFCCSPNVGMCTVTKEGTVLCLLCYDDRSE